uniref:Sphingomyelin synthase-like domain-containing protein n=1 Tax=Polytomella parva TaxID=51329 RepID=A0A7S0VA99_9CHLO|mmetsp:Transcript_28331/g.52177  ORF Transcript_28331/g.52177 Transcript_28331/m.52177 type:complete len:309 (+) Transcript_28331:77-1003(+)
MSDIQLFESLRLHRETLCSSFLESATEIWRRIKLEFTVELPLLRKRWKQLLFGLIMQYVHGIFTGLAHRMHTPLEEPLHDVGFEITPELGPDKHWVSETIFGVMFFSFIAWTFTPFVTKRKRFYTAVLWPRLLMVLVTCQALRIITFTVTQVPGPSFHCRKGEVTAIRPWPKHWYQLLIVDVGRAMSKSCGDLIFSSHTTFMLTGVLAYNEYGSNAITKGLAWLGGVVLSVLIIASRKHYTVDVVVAWYTVPLVFFMMFRRWTTRRPMNEFLGNSDISQFDIVDGSEFDLDEAFEQKNGDIESKPITK